MTRLTRCSVTAVCLALAAGCVSAHASDEVAPVSGYGPWRFGMTREQVRAVEKHAPYAEVAVTGGLETRNGELDGRETPVSFVFGPQGLYQIQIWAYTGDDFDRAAAAWHRVYRHLEDHFGEVTSGAEPWPRGVSAEDLETALTCRFGGGGEPPPWLETLQAEGTIEARTSQVELRPTAAVPGADVSSSFVTSPQLGLYWVFLFYRSPPP